MPADPLRAAPGQVLHGITLARTADQVLRMDAGRIVERGAPQEVLRHAR